MRIPNLDDDLKSRLRVRAARHGRSMEEEARAILEHALASEITGTPDLAESIRRQIEPLGGLDISESREPVRRPPNIAE